MIAEALITFAARHRLDEDGRPVAEIASPHYDPARTELQRCPYPDARLGQPMNRSALRQMADVWPALLDSVRWCVGGEPTVHRAWRAAVAGLAAPALWPEAEVPRLLSAQFKASLGLSQVLTTLLLGEAGAADARLVELGDADAFFAQLDAGRWLIGESQVCAGSASMIGALFDALSDGAPGAPDPAWSRLGDGWFDAATEAVAVHAAHLALASRQVGAGRPVRPETAAWVGGRVPPWLRGVLGVPDRAPDAALRLFPTGRAPVGLRAYLDGPGDADARWDAWRASAT